MKLADVTRPPAALADKQLDIIEQTAQAILMHVLGILLLMRHELAPDFHPGYHDFLTAYGCNTSAVTAVSLCHVIGGAAAAAADRCAHHATHPHAKTLQNR